MKRLAAATPALLFLCSTALHASVLDTFVCQWAGCAVMQNAGKTGVYLLNDVPGTPAALWWQYASPFTTPPAQPVSIDVDGDGSGDIVMQDYGQSGVLDAGDSLPPFSIGSQTRLSFGRPLTRRLRMASNRPFDLYAQARAPRLRGRLRRSLTGMTHQVRISPTGNAVEASLIPVSLAELLAGPVKIAAFTRATRRYAASDHQALEMVTTYALPDYDLSQGTGGIAVTVEYRIYQ